MNKVTSDYFMICTKCEKHINHYYLDGNNEICCDCLVKKHKGFPKGKGCYKPCKSCKPPSITWFYEDTYGKINNACHIHNKNENSDEDDDMFSAMF